MHNNFIKHFFVILIIFSNHSFGKEFEELFTIYVPIENSNKIESSINESFNNLVFRISGSKSPSNIWKIINSGSSRKDFIQSYSIKNINTNSYLEVNFDQELIINKFKELSIPIVGHSRPVIFFLINIESGSGEPYYVSQQANNEIDFLIIETLAELSNKRGLFLELPVLDLDDKRYLSNTNILSSPKEHLISKYDFDEFVDVKLTNLGLNQWLFSGDIKEDILAENYLEDIKKVFADHVESKIQSIYKNLIVDTSKTLLLDVTIEGINSYEEYEISKDKLFKIIAISNLEILNLNNNTISYQISLMGNFDTFKNTIENNTFFEIMAENSKNSLNLRFVK
tara:strand:- start:311 stop:1330 length:1020 start_codon:yes stop_codon:yes gene_type:complete